MPSEEIATKNFEQETVFTLEWCRKIDSALRDVSDEELTKARDTLIALAQIAYDAWVGERTGS